MKKCAWFVGGIVLLSALLLSCGGCVGMSFLFGPTDAQKQAADTNKDGVVSPEERKDAGLPPDGSPWIELGLEALGYLLPGAGVGLLAYRKAKQNRAHLESVIVGVENIVKKAPEMKGQVYSELKAAAIEYTDPDQLAKIVAAVKEQLKTEQAKPAA